MNRRQFLKASGYVFVTAKLAGLVGCGDDGGMSQTPPGTYRFPHGVASGDPHADSVVLWTRAERASGAKDAVDVTAQVATAEDFSKIVAEKALKAEDARDFTLRLVVDGLMPATTYYYRFKAGADTSTVGRTRTAPAKDDTRNVNIAWVSCQDYSAGFYGAWRRMINEDKAAAAADQIDVVVHVGDFIYETRADGFQAAQDENFMPIVLKDAQGRERVIEKFPNGGVAGDTQYALTLADYRHLYKQFLRDPDLQAARARWPFINTWDDHEFTNDAWQTQANYTDAMGYDEAQQQRKVAANQAWFEYVPTNLSGASTVAGVTNKAKDFQFASVSDKQYGDADIGDDWLIKETNNVAALGTMTIYRSFRFGKNVELVVTDLRSYRSDHPIPEDWSKGDSNFFDPRNAVPLSMVNTMDAGKTANNNNPPDTIGGKPNPRKNAPPGTMMGAEQKAWWKDTMKKSDATWKVWATSVPLTRMLLNVEDAGVLLYNRVCTGDAWDGWPGERRELMKYLLDNDIRNVVAIAGDVHSHFVSLIYDDFDAMTPKPVLQEFTAAGISSNTIFSFFEGPTRALPQGIRQLITYDATAKGGPKFVRNFNTALLWGGKAAAKAAETNDPAAALALRDAKVNPHFRYVDTDARGYGVLRAAANAVTAQMVTVPAPTMDYGEAGPPLRTRATFKVDPTPQGAAPKLDPPMIEGTKPFPLT